MTILSDAPSGPWIVSLPAHPFPEPVKPKALRTFGHGSLRIGAAAPETPDRALDAWNSLHGPAQAT